MDLSITISTPGSSFSPIVFQGEYIEQIKLAGELGFKYVELHVRDPKLIDLSDLKKCLVGTGIQVSTIGTGQAYVDDHLYFSSPDEVVRQQAIERVKAQIKFAAELKAKVILGTIKGPLPVDKKVAPIARNYILESLAECVEFAEKFEVQLTIEAINRYETNFLNNAAETVALIKELGSTFLGLHLDTFHMNIEEVSIEETLHEYASYLVHLHVADSNRWSPGMGHLDFQSIINTLKEIDYQGFLGVECLPLPTSQEAAIQTLKFMNRLMGKNP